VKKAVIFWNWMVI